MQGGHNNNKAPAKQIESCQIWQGFFLYMTPIWESLCAYMFPSVAHIYCFVGIVLNLALPDRANIESKI